MPVTGQLFFMYATMLIAVPTGVKVFNWIATMWKGSMTFETPMLFAVGFLFVFTMGGLTGVILAIAPIDIQLQDTYYVVAHFHYVLVAGSLFALFAGFYYWSPKWTGHMYNETRGRIHFWSSLISFNVTFFPMHFLGLAGMPRRYADYPMQFADFHMIATIGAFWFGLTQVYFLLAVVIPCIKGGPKAADKPWDGAEGLEWTIPSPAPFHTFETPATGALTDGHADHARRGAARAQPTDRVDPGRGRARVLLGGDPEIRVALTGRSRTCPSRSPSRRCARRLNASMLGKLVVVVALMFGFGYALVPLYNKICEVTGINNLTQTDGGAADFAKNTQVDRSRTVTVEFDGNSRGPWRFKPVVGSMQVHPGELTTVTYEIANQQGRAMQAQAIPSYMPTVAMQYFRKVECFCFKQQSLKPHEAKQFPVVFVIDPKLPANVNTITLSYTFFEVGNVAPVAAASGTAG